MTIFQKGRTVLEKKVLKYHSDVELTDVEEKAVIHFFCVINTDLHVKLDEVTRMQAANEFKRNVTIAHNILGPLTGECKYCK